MLKVFGQTITYSDLCAMYPKKTFPAETKLRQEDLPQGITITETDLSELKAAKQQQLSEAFSTFVKTSFTTTHGYIMQFDETDSLKLEGYIKLLTAAGQTEGYITDAKDISHSGITLQTIKEIQLEMLARYAEAHAAKQAIRAAITAAETKEQLNAITLRFTKGGTA